MRKYLLVIFCTTILVANSQTNIPNSFKEFKLGLTIEKFNQMDLTKSSDNYIQLEFNEISYTGMDLFKIKNQTTKSGESIGLVVGFYDKKLALIVVKYNDFYNEILSGLVEKYGNYSRAFKDEYQNPLGNNIIRIKTFYWDKFLNCKLCLYYNETGVLTQVLFADKTAQKMILSNKQKINKSRIE